MQTEEGEDPWAGVGMDAAEELEPGIPAKAGSQAEDATDLNGLEEGPDKMKQAERRAEAASDPGEELSEQRGRKWWDVTRLQ